MLSKKMQDAINEQIKNELYSGYLYLAMAAYAEEQNLPGFAHWMKTQCQEEVEHAMKFFNYVAERGGRVELHAIDQPPVEFASPTALFEETLAHEKKVTALIHGLYDLALEEKDYASQVLLHWYIDEQVEEEKNASMIVDQLKLIEARGTAVLMLDKQLGKRGGE
jgi:ferritin